MTLADLARTLSGLDVPAPPDLTLDDVLQLVAGARETPATRGALAASLNGIDVEISDLLAAGQIFRAGPYRYVVSRADFERVRGRKVLAFPERQR